MMRAPKPAYSYNPSGIVEPQQWLVVSSYRIFQMFRLIRRDPQWHPVITSIVRIEFQQQQDLIRPFIATQIILISFLWARLGKRDTNSAT